MLSLLEANGDCSVELLLSTAVRAAESPQLVSPLGRCGGAAPLARPSSPHVFGVMLCNMSHAHRSCFHELFPAAALRAAQALFPGAVDGAFLR